MSAKRMHILEVMTLCMVLAGLCLTLPAQEKEQPTPSAPPPEASQKTESSSAQATTTPASNPEVKQEPVEAGGYRLSGSFEFGGHITDFSGSPSLWSTYVNLDSGPRLLEQSWEMRSIGHNGVLFDDLTLHSFGYGGDPNNLTRLTLDKGRWYDFTANFRRDRNFFDYDLLANPLNPANSNPNVPQPISPHLLALVRRNTDLNLRLLPVGKLHFRLVYTRDVNQGFSLATLHEGTEALTFQPERDTINSYQLGVSYEAWPRTVLNYDQFFTDYKGDTTWQVAPGAFTLSNGTLTNLGIAFNTLANQPCAKPFTATGTVTPTCNQDIGYSKVDPFRSSYPTEQFSFQSNYFRRVDLSGRVNYSSAEDKMPLFAEVFGGFLSRTSEQSHLQGGPAKATRVLGSADFAVTYHVNDNLRFVESFRWSNFRIPGGATFLTTTLFAPNAIATANVFSPTTCPTATSPGCPQHTASSGPDIASDTFVRFLKQDYKLNTFEMDFDPTRRFGVRLGYRYGNRHIIANQSLTELATFFPNRPTRGACAGQPVVNNICQVTTTDSDENDTSIHENSALLGFWARPLNELRLNVDAELFSADNVFTRISPRNMQFYRLRSVYKPLPWLNLAAGVNLQERKNEAATIEHREHSRSYSFNGVFAKSERWDFDLSYSYQDIFSTTNICFVSTPRPPFALDCGAPFLSAPSLYKDHEHFGAANIMFKPITRVTTWIGYTLTSTNGSALILNPNSPTGPLSLNYHLPTASVAVDLNRSLTWKMGWNYYGYNEKSDPGPTLPRDFRGNVFTLSLRYHLGE